MLGVINSQDSLPGTRKPTKKGMSSNEEVTYFLPAHIPALMGGSLNGLPYAQP